MSTENANSAPAESASISDAISFNDAMHIDFDEEADDANPQEPDAPAQEASATEPGEEPDEEAGAADDDEQQAQDDDEGRTEEPKEPTSLADDALVTLDNGSQLTLAELKKNHMLERDYRHKTHELSNARRDLEARSNRVSGVLDALVDHLAQRLPEEPSLDLARTNPAEYVQRKALFDQANAQLQVILQQGSDAKQVIGELSTEQHNQLVQAENARLLERLPELREPTKRAEFNKATLDAVQALGFTPEEFAQNPDHRLVVAAHYAGLGMAAEKAKQKAAQKAVNVPPVVPPTKRVERNQDQAYRANKENMSRLKRTGRLADAMKVDFI